MGEGRGPLECSIRTRFNPLIGEITFETTVNVSNTGFYSVFHAVCEYRKGMNVECEHCFQDEEF